ncbi:MAG: AsmA family protein [Pseudomonadota bacterium]
MRYVGIGILFLFALIVAGLLLAPRFIPPSVIKEQIETNASKALGRPVTLASEPTISFLPPKAQVSGLMVANASGFSAPHLVSVEKADVGLKLLPLFMGRAEITKFELVRPDIRLETNKQGQANWTLGPQAPEDSADQAEQTSGGTGPLNDLRLGNVRIVDGTVVLHMADTEPYKAENANIVFGLESLDKPLTLDGTLTLQGEPSTVRATFATPRQFAQSSRAEMTLAMSVGDNTIDTDMSLKEGLSFDGNVDIDFPALRAFLALAGTAIETPSGFQRLRLKGPLTGNPERLSFGEGTELSFDAIEGEGAVTLDLAGARPKLSGVITAQTLDLNAYLPEEPDAVKTAKAAPAKGEKPSFPAWSSDDMDFSALSAMDTDLKISAQQLLIPSLTVGPSSVTLKVDNGRAVADISKMTLYRGTGKGKFVLNTRGRRPSMSVDAALDGVDVGAFATDFAGLTRLKGMGDVSINITTAGRSQAALVRSLNGTTSIALSDGTIEGVNLGQLIRGAAAAYKQVREEGLSAATIGQSFGQLATAANGPTEKTDFSALGVVLGITNGVVQSKSVALAGPYFDIGGSAMVNLPDQTMRMTLTPSVSDVDGDAKRPLPVPILVSGSFNEPKIGLDTDAVLKGVARNALSDALKNQGIDIGEGQSLEDALEQKALGALGDLLSPKKNDESSDGNKGNDKDVDAGSTTEPEKDPAQDLLEQGLGAIFGEKADQ